jgi:Mrp family chromosome partitioning ATPase
MALALANRRVLLIDICARRPSVERNMGIQVGSGLAEIFESKATLSTCARPAGVPGLDVLGPGTAKNLIVGQYASRELVQLLEEAEQKYDHVIIDSPPALLMADAGLLAPVVDGVILVAGSGVSTQGMVRRCIQELNQAGAHLIGVVLNRMKPVPGGYMERNLNSYYHYGRDESDYGRPADLARKSSSGCEAAPTLLLIEESGRGAVTDPPFAPRI